MKKAVAYYRASTDRQEKSGLGLEAQQLAVGMYVEHNEYSLIGEFIEIESGKETERPVLECALKLCRKEDAVLLIAKQDRLARNVGFIAMLLASNNRFIAVDMPYANKFMMYIKAAYDEQEREDISLRTRNALQVAKAKGVVLGKHGKEVLSRENREAADAFAMLRYPLIRTLLDQGLTLRAICRELNRRRVPTFHKRHPMSITAILVLPQFWW